ncbi:hypothetical protein [Streptomyces sp. Ru72]|uniref:hypothetical protein n=1 Tax=Streptomyces sp. Ru72 TaxID=2080747 RepID=UPI0026D79FA1
MTAAAVLDLSPGAGLVLDGTEWTVERHEANSIDRTCVKSARSPSARVPQSVKYDSVIASATIGCSSSSVAPASWSWSIWEA